MLTQNTTKEGYIIAAVMVKELLEAIFVKNVLLGVF